MRCRRRTSMPYRPPDRRCPARRGATPRAAPLRCCSRRSMRARSSWPAKAMADDAALQTYLWKSEGALFASAGRILAPGAMAAIEVAAAASGQAYGLARLLLRPARARCRAGGCCCRSRASRPPARCGGACWPASAGPGVAGLLAGLRDEVRRSLVTSRQHVANLPREVRVAFLPLALVRSYLRALERRGRDVLRESVEIAPLTRVLRIAAAHWLGRI